LSVASPRIKHNTNRITKTVMKKKILMQFIYHNDE
jgi:hypothetical protein